LLCLIPETRTCDMGKDRYILGILLIGAAKEKTIELIDKDFDCEELAERMVI